MKKGKRNILAILDRADEIDINEGRLAYLRYNELCHKIADRYFVEFPTVVAVFAALSPNNDYLGNVKSCLSVIEGFQALRPATDIRVSTYGHCRDRALNYLRGVDFLGTVEGKKIRSFYQNIMNPSDPFPVTVDGHAVNMWQNKIQSVKKARAFNYERIAGDFRAVAASKGLLPNQVQAITWFTWKRINRILFKPQLELFGDPADRWKTLVDIETIKTFKEK